MSLQSRYLLTAETEADPQAPSRILQLVTRRNLLPSWFSARTCGPDRLRIVMEVRGFDPRELEYLEQSVLKIPSVISVDVRAAAQREQMLA